jgi:hypothetical protein
MKVCPSTDIALMQSDTEIGTLKKYHEEQEKDVA